MGTCIACIILRQGGRLQPLEEVSTVSNEMLGKEISGSQNCIVEWRVIVQQELR